MAIQELCALRQQDDNGDDESDEEEEEFDKSEDEEGDEVSSEERENEGHALYLTLEVIFCFERSQQGLNLKPTFPAIALS